MTERSDGTEALDEFFRIIRDKAARDHHFQIELVQALQIPIKIEHEPKAFSKNLPYYDPVVIAGEGIDEFRRIFRPMTDAQLRKIILHFNIASKDAIPTKGGPKGEELFEILWKGAEHNRRKLSGN